MSDFRVALAYFSATHVTKTYAEVIQKELLRRGCEAQLVDVTAYGARQRRLPVDDFDGFIFGFPVFADFAPSVINEWLPTLDGKGKKVATFFTYGGRTTGYAHFHTKLLLEKAGFRVQFSAEFLGRHTFNIAGWRALPNRPDERDFAVARESPPWPWNDLPRIRPGCSRSRNPLRTTARWNCCSADRKAPREGGAIRSALSRNVACAAVVRSNAPPRPLTSIQACRTLYDVSNVCTACTSVRNRP